MAARRKERRRARRKRQEAAQEALVVLRRVTEVAICRRMFAADGELRDLRRGLYRLWSLGCQGKGLDYLVKRRACQITNEVRAQLREALGEACYQVAIPRPAEEGWLAKIFPVLAEKAEAEWRECASYPQRRAMMPRARGRAADQEGGDA